MDFYGKVKAVAVKDTPKSGTVTTVSIESGMGAESVAALYGLMGERVRVTVEEPQVHTPLRVAPEQMSLDEAPIPEPAPDGATPGESRMCGEQAYFALTFTVDAKGEPAPNGEQTTVFRCMYHAEVLRISLAAAEIAFGEEPVASERFCDAMVPVNGPSLADETPATDGEGEPESADGEAAEPDGDALASELLPDAPPEGDMEREAESWEEAGETCVCGHPLALHGEPGVGCSVGGCDCEFFRGASEWSGNGAEKPTAADMIVAEADPTPARNRRAAFRTVK